MRLAAAFIPLLILAACATPREACVNDATRDLNRVNRLITDTQANIGRGFGLETRQETTVRRGRCTGTTVDSEGETISFRYACDRTEVVDREFPVTIDLAAERVKLSQLLDQQSRLERQSQARIQSCIAAHPE